MTMHKGKYGTWGFEQFEVNGNKNPKDAANKWIVETQSGKEPKVYVREANEQKSYSFIKKWAELQAVMLNENSRLTASHPFQSAPYIWPFMLRGISFWIKEPDAQLYFIGNPVVWALGLLAIMTHFALILVDQVALRRGIDEISYIGRRKFMFTGGFFLSGWILHYWPFFIMGRALFIHHYLPALIFSVLCFANLFDLLLSFSPTLRRVVAFVIMGLAVAGYLYFAPFVYGTPLTAEAVKSRQWLPNWDFHYAKV
jgi:dolichyl-phosphate-mannose-protein mannosyltransferase